MARGRVRYPCRNSNGLIVSRDEVRNSSLLEQGGQGVYCRGAGTSRLHGAWKIPGDGSFQRQRRNYLVAENSQRVRPTHSRTQRPSPSLRLSRFDCHPKGSLAMKRRNRGPIYEQRRNGSRRITSSIFDLSKDLCGVVKQGPPDLATNPRHLHRFGR